MQCQQCKQREATTHIQRVVNGQAEEFHLCAACARESGLINEFAAPPFFNLSDLFSGFLGSSLRQAPAALAPAQRCGFCGSTLHEITQSGRVGCAACYNTFREVLEPTLARIHGALEHAGKTPAADPAVHARKQKEQALAALREQIAQAVQSEDYEEAARLRDEIRRLEGTQEEGGNDHAA
ncbi:MAG: UvrB/UvrC motif-containing protein [Oscillospiraceae bacterium]|jgi:protein arginine kinase activator|nr:UvrB/UvrC motif-containing protein [Oscillospiraceae bacterium]